MDWRRFNFPGQVNFARAFERYLDAVKTIYAELPDDWRLFTEHKMYRQPSIRPSVQDWGTNIIAKETGERAFCLVDLGHHAPNVNIEMIVSRLIQFGKLGGFHFNDSKYGDDDLDAGSIDPYRLFLVFNELVDAELSGAKNFNPAHMLDQSHNVTDLSRALMFGHRSDSVLAQALLVDRKALKPIRKTMMR
jgi:L-rhamnose isomerase/sugar isomerase